MSDLLKLNVNGHIEKKNGLSYLSWAWAWAEVLKIDPNAEWEAIEYPQPDGTVAPCMYVNETAMVKAKVTIKGKTRTCMLPVMDHRNKAIKSPDAFAINTAIMRCMTKAISMHGLGLYIYAGEDLPEGDEGEKPEARNENGTLPGPKHKPTDGAWERLDDDQQRYVLLLASVTKELAAKKDYDEICARIEREGLDADMKVAWWTQLDSTTRSSIKKEEERRRLMASDGKAKQADVYRVADTQVQ